MHLLIRPSKSFVFDCLEKELKKIKSGIGIDAASAGMKNRYMFKTHRYIGIDIDRALLEFGLKKYPGPTTIGLWADITNLDSITENIADVVVSTNTIHQIPPPKRSAVIAELSRITAPQGTFICELTMSSDFNNELKLLENNFGSIKKIYYKNPVSYVYEHFFEQDGYLGSHPVAGLLPFRIFSWFLSRLEYLTCSFRPLNRQVLLICHNKKNVWQKKVFNLENMRKISDRLYSLL